MRPLFLGLGAIVLGMACTTATEASPHGRPAGHGPVIHGPARPVIAHRPVVVHPVGPYHLRHGVRFGGGYFYRSGLTPIWGRTVWVPSFNRYQYFDADQGVWYFFDPIRGIYVPVGVAPPIVLPSGVPVSPGGIPIP